jgi:hypothetical protein
MLVRLKQCRTSFYPKALLPEHALSYTIFLSLAHDFICNGRLVGILYCYHLNATYFPVSLYVCFVEPLPRIDLHCFTIWLCQAYVQNLESSRLKLTKLEQELQQARQQVCALYSHTDLSELSWIKHATLLFDQCILLQGIFISSSGDQSHSTSGNGNILYKLQ